MTIMRALFERMKDPFRPNQERMDKWTKQTFKKEKMKPLRFSTGERDSFKRHWSIMGQTKSILSSDSNSNLGNVASPARVLSVGYIAI